MILSCQELKDSSQLLPEDARECLAPKECSSVSLDSSQEPECLLGISVFNRVHRRLKREILVLDWNPKFNEVADSLVTLRYLGEGCQDQDPNIYSPRYAYGSIMSDTRGITAHTSSRRVVGPSRNRGGRSNASESSLFCLYQLSIPGSPCCMRWVTTALQRSCSPYLSTDNRH